MNILKHPSKRKINVKLFISFHVSAQVYHGIAPCKLDDEEKLMIFKTYDSADASKKRELERIYGRRLIQELVEKQLTRDYLKVT